MKVKRLWHLSWILFSLILQNACCSRTPQQQPTLPSNVRGWGEFSIDGTHFLGELVLRKGEETSSGNIVVKVTDVDPPDPCAEPDSFYGSPRVTLQFHLVSDPQRKCEITARKSSKIIECDFPIEASIINVISINSEEKWAYFDLRK